MKPEIILAATPMSVYNDKETWISNQFHSLELSEGVKGCER